MGEIRVELAGETLETVTRGGDLLKPDSNHPSEHTHPSRYPIKICPEFLLFISILRRCDNIKS